MAVPKRKTSRSRRDKRRAQHGISVAARPGLPDLQAAEAAASRLPELQDVQGPGRRAAPPRGAVATLDPWRSGSPSMRSGATARPRRSSPARSRPPPPRSSRFSSARAASTTHGLPLVETSESRSSMDDHAVEAVRSKPDSSLVRAVRAVADGEAEAVVSAGNTGAMLAASLLHIRRLPGRAPAGDRGRHPDEARAERPHRRRRERRRAPRAPRPVRAHGRGLRRGDPRGAESRGAAALDRRGGREGQPAHARGARAPPRERTSGSAGTPRAGRCSRATPTSSSRTASRGTSR